MLAERCRSTGVLVSNNAKPATASQRERGRLRDEVDAVGPAALQTGPGFKKVSGRTKSDEDVYWKPRCQTRDS